ncbi:hypothetical protein [Nocardia brasiliensis]|uniref:hypothetical protein n=1 Tax=Nocardia brasiliensis TaxID=37326 RepID=UPI00366FAF5C
MSTLAKALDDGTNLARWKQAMTAIGLVKDRSLLARIAAMLAKPNRDVYRANRAALAELCEQALAAAGAGQKAAIGTAVHEFTEAIDGGFWPEFIPADLVGPLNAYRSNTAVFEVVDIEVFVVVDELTAAGSLDRLVRLPDGRVIVGDIKTGAHEPDYPLGVTTQCAIYAHGKRYDAETGQRALLHPDLDVSTGVLIHLPLERGVDGYRCDLYALDLEWGWAAAQAAIDVRELRRIPKLKELQL